MKKLNQSELVNNKVEKKLGDIDMALTQHTKASFSRVAPLFPLSIDHNIDLNIGFNWTEKFPIW